ncbi:hypothetical protein CVD28_15700 [Bacillus sp. M6-12]|uniref:UPF0223 family protein n=1 Tax=Bacillus sp. M6-12 TaxID=2054166 RepID=UPI000C7876BB|nr:UPF0223 family protein [Bacillus sp. M6-12]PLS16528.1 hypothetical protein CVD28_15700 [Bacillus sp. M6-12]
MEYQYPIDYDWSTEETVDVIQFYECIEKAYEQKISKNELMEAYRRFKKVVPGKADEKKLTDEFEEISGYSAYLAIKKAKDSDDGEMISLSAGKK